ncbi:hypothetical protein [Roseovarius sp. 2305UL8-3]|uniref:hypothetical protein n=1 Tax=Roseovarius conchicola TaxID=3121636 RepID=UPI003527717D
MKRWILLREQTVKDIADDFPVAAELARSYFAGAPKPTLSELIPLFLRGRSSRGKDALYDTAWILLYLAASLMDDLQDGEIESNQENVASVQILSVVAASRVGRLSYPRNTKTESVIRKALVGQLLSLENNCSYSQILQSAAQKNALLELPISRELGAGAENASIVEALQIAVQCMDDLTDVFADSRRGATTTISCREYQGMSDSEILAKVVKCGRLADLLRLIQKNADSFKNELASFEGDRTPLYHFLSAIVYATDDLLKLENEVSMAIGGPELEQNIAKLKQRIEVYAIGS